MILTERDPRPTRKVYERLIDVDVHPRFKDGLSTIYPHLRGGWKRKLEHLATGGQHDNRDLTRFVNPLGKYVMKVDSTPPSGDPPGTDVDFVKVDLLDRYGIDIALLVALEAGKTAVATADPDMSAALCQAYNDFLIGEWLEDPRFRLAMNVTPHDPEAATAEIHRLGDTPGIAGVFLPLINIRLGSRYFHPIYEAALEYGLPIIIHPVASEGTYVGAPLFAGGSPESYFEFKMAWPELAQASVTSLILRGTFNRYPLLKVLLLEFGFTWAVPLIWRMDTTWRELRIDVPWVKKWPSEYFREHIFIATQPLEEPANRDDLYHLVETYLADSLAFSSDYPHWDFDEPGKVFRTLSEPTKGKIFYKNAESVLRLG